MAKPTSVNDYLEGIPGKIVKKNFSLDNYRSGNTIRDTTSCSQSAEENNTRQRNFPVMGDSWGVQNYPE